MTIPQSPSNPNKHEPGTESIKEKRSTTPRLTKEDNKNDLRIRNCNRILLKRNIQKQTPGIVVDMPRIIDTQLLPYQLSSFSRPI